MPGKFKSEGDSEKLIYQKLSAGFSGIESDRRALGVSQTVLAHAAGMSFATYARLIASPARARPETVARLRKALAGLKGRAARPASGPDAGQVRAIYGGFLLAVAPHHGVTASQIHEALKLNGERTLDPHWRACSHARQAAIYLTHTSLGLKQKVLADVLGLTPAAVCLAIRAVEDRREEAIFDAVLNAAEAAIMGGSA